MRGRTARDAARLGPAAWSRRLLCMMYESLIVVALVLVGGLLAVWLPADREGVAGGSRLILQLWVAGLVSAYFAGCWHTLGQTLAMKTWRLLITAADGAPPSLQQSLLRLVVAAGTLPLSVLWPLFDRERLFLHDRLAGTRIWHIDPDRLKE